MRAGAGRAAHAWQQVFEQVPERRERVERHVVVRRQPVLQADLAHELRLADAVDPQIRLQVRIELHDLTRIPRLLHHEVDQERLQLHARRTTAHVPRRRDRGHLHRPTSRRRHRRRRHDRRRDAMRARRRSSRRHVRRRVVPVAMRFAVSVSVAIAVAVAHGRRGERGDTAHLAIGCRHGLARPLGGRPVALATTGGRVEHAHASRSTHSPRARRRGGG